MNKQGKVWGQTSKIFDKNNVEIHRIVGKKGGHCSKHRHNHKFNMFYVESGCLSVKIWKGYGLVDETVLDSGESCVVEPGEFHQFEVIKDDTIAFEVYWVELDLEDIEREGHGGMNERVVL